MAPVAVAVVMDVIILRVLTEHLQEARVVMALS
jgi:hypothetical protein